MAMPYRVNGERAITRPASGLRPTPGFVAPLIVRRRMSTAAGVAVAPPVAGLRRTAADPAPAFCMRNLQDHGAF
jgi:hypothetical protein